MKASIIITAYNIENYIERSIMSVINQTEKDIEIIIVNDGSTDGTLNIIKRLASYDKRIKIVDKKNEGVMKARYCGFNKAIGEYILFLDGDDWIEESTIDELYKEALRNNSDIVIYSSYKVISNEIRYKQSVIQNVEDDLLKLLMTGNSSQYLWDKFIRRKFILKNNISILNDFNYAEDLAVLCNIYTYNPRVSILDIPLYNYYQRSDSLTKKTTEKIIDVERALEYIKKKMCERNIYVEYKREFEMCMYLNLFIYPVIDVYNKNRYNKEIYKIYKRKKIKVNSNRYIKGFVFNYNFNGKLRINLYQKSYSLGVVYDFIRGKIKNLKNRGCN